MSVAYPRSWRPCGCGHIGIITHTALHMMTVVIIFKCILIVSSNVIQKKQTPLHLAAETGQLEVCRLLMGLRANPDAADEKGQKPIHLAAENNHAGVIKLFLRHQSTLVSSATKVCSLYYHCFWLTNIPISHIYY